MNCVVCDTEIQEGDLKIAHCQHRFHINCFLIEVCAKFWIERSPRCPTCNQTVFEENAAILEGIHNRIHEIHGQDNAETDEEDDAGTQPITGDELAHMINAVENETYKVLYSSSENFRTDIKAMKTTIKEVRVLKNEVIPLVKQKETELKQKVDPLVKTINSFADMIKSARKTAIQEIRATPQMKAFTKKRSLLSRQYNRIITIYGRRGLYIRNAIPGVTLRYYSPFYKLARRIRSKYRYF